MHGSLWHMGCHFWTCVCGSICLVQAVARVHMSCSLHSIKSKETQSAMCQVERVIVQGDKEQN